MARPWVLKAKLAGLPTVAVVAFGLTKMGAVALGSATTMEKVWLAAPPGLEAERVKTPLPVLVGMPVTTPVLGSRLRPAGRAPAVIS